MQHTARQSFNNQIRDSDSVKPLRYVTLQLEGDHYFDRKPKPERLNQVLLLSWVDSRGLPPSQKYGHSNIRMTLQTSLPDSPTQTFPICRKGELF